MKRQPKAPTTSRDATTVALMVDNASIWPQPGDVVQHYKGGLYIVLLLAVDEETQRERVIYMEAKPPQKGKRPARVWDRRLEEWSAFVDATTPRFRNVRRASKAKVER